MEFFTEYGEANQFQIQEVIGKGSYGVVAAAIDTHTGERVAIKKIKNVFENVSDAARILREIKLLRLLRHPNIVQIKHIMLPPTRREFRDIYVVFELMESDLHQVIKANDNLTPEHHRFFLYQLLRALKYIHAAHVFHRDLKPRNILANSDCKLKICDFGLARASFSDSPSSIFWTDYVATRWYRAPELCGSFFSSVSQSLTSKLTVYNNILSDKARKYLIDMQMKHPVPFSHKFHNADPLALRLLERLLAFDPKDRPTAEEALADPYFRGLSKLEHEPSAQPISKLDFEFEERKLTKDDVREMIYREILEYHPQMLQEYIEGGEQIHFLYPRERVCSSSEDGHNQDPYNEEGRASSYVARTTISSPRSQEEGCAHQSAYHSGDSTSCAKSYLKSAANISASRRAIKGRKGPKEKGIPEDVKEEVVHGLLDKVSRVLS
nr:unnamed protein product [Digitaria exilis]